MRPASESLLKGQGFYRIRRRLVGAGDIFPIDIGAKVIAVGPDSDVSAFTVYYPDPTSPTGVNSAPLSAGAPFIVPVSARNAEPLGGTLIGSQAVKGRIFVAARELFDVRAVLGTTTDGLTRQFVYPEIDLLVYASNPPAVPMKRASKRFMASFMSPAGEDVGGFLAIPTYGRRRITAAAQVLRSADLTVDLYGVRLALPVQRDASIGAAFSVEYNRLDEVTIGDNQSVGFTIDAYQERAVQSGGPATDKNHGGFFDYILFGGRYPAGSSQNVPSDSPNGGVRYTVEVSD